MPTSFHDLPREIRDEIYSYALYPTGILTLKPSKIPKKLILEPSICNSKNGRVTPVGKPINALLIAASRQIHRETRDLLWACNEIYFPTSRSLIQGFRTLGQSTSRRVAHVRLTIQFEAEVRKALAMLASRGRKGDLKRVTLVVPAFDQTASVRDPSIRSPRYDDFLDALREMVAAGVKIEKTIEVKSFFLWRRKNDQRSTGLRETHRHIGEQAIYELHCAWGGRLICNGSLFFKDYKRADEDRRPISLHLEAAR